MNTIPTDHGNKSPSQIMDILRYASYKANRGYGMTHESLVRLFGLDDDTAEIFKYHYELTLISNN